MPAASASTVRHTPSLESRFRPSSRREGLIARRRLLRALDATRKLTLLSAPCGYGKTSLLATWVERAPRQPVAWLTLESSDSNGARMWAQVADAVERVRPGAGRRAGALLRARGVATDVALHELLADLATAAPLTIVLDDLHVVEDPECYEGLEYAVEHLPPSVRMVAATRWDPPLQLGRLRARGLLGEIRGRDLAFEADEAAEIVARCGGVRLDEDELRILLERTEGWPVAVYLTALWLREQDEPRLMLNELAAGRSFIGEYLTDEVLGALGRRTRDFLVRTSVLSYLSASLCDAVLARDDSAEILREISSSNLLVTKLEREGEWFRVHGLFRELLRLELDQQALASAVELHRRAAAWLEEHDFLLGAVTHAVEAGEHEQAAEIISASWEELLLRGDGELLVQLVDHLPLDVVLANPELAAGSALATYAARRPRHERERWLSTARRSHRLLPDRWSPRAAIVASLARALAVDGSLASARVHARRAIKVAARAGLETYELSARSALAYAFYLDGNELEASEQATRALAVPQHVERPNGALRSLGVLALVALDAGRVAEAEADTRRALALARAHGLSASSSVHIAHVARARVLLAKGQPRAAEGAAELGERLCRMPDPTPPHTFALLVLAETQIRNGLLRDAEATLVWAKREVETFADSGRLPKALASIRRVLREARKAHSVSVEQLSPAELSVLRLLATGLSQRSIGRELFLSVNTIKTHSRSIYRKLGVASRADAVARAKALELITAS